MCALKALRLQEIDGQLTATAFDYVEYPKILSQPDADMDQLVREALEQFLSRNNLRGDTVAIAVPGQSGLARFVKLPPVEEKKIADIVKFEAKQQIPFNLEEVVWDYQKIGTGNVVDGFALETEIGLFAMKRDMVKRYLDHFKEVGVDVHVIQMAPLALCNFVAFDLLGKDVGAAPPAEGEKPGCVVALDIGTDSTNLVITDGGKIIWQRPIPLGGNHFTRALTKELKLTFAKAEHLKRNATKSGPQELKKMLGALKPVLNDFVGEVQRSLGYFTNTHRDAQIEYMIGLGNAFRLPGMQRFLAEKLQLEVKKLDKMTRLSGDVLVTPIYAENILSFGVAYGLALQGLSRAKLITNLLPGEIRIERLVKAKKPWAAAAAGLLIVGLAGAAAGNYFDLRPYIAPSVKTAIDRAKKAKSSADSSNSAFDSSKQGALKEEEAVKAIVAGQAERRNWLELPRFINICIPQPDGSNLPPEVKDRYFEKRPVGLPSGVFAMSGKEAFEKYKERMREANKPPAEDGKEEALPPGIDDLVQFHIESIDSRFCDDLGAFWTQATKLREEADVRPLEHYKKKPEGKGWVIEIAGFTYHRDKEAFIRNTLLANIARLGIKATLVPAGDPKAAPGDKKPDGATPPPAVSTPAPATAPAAPSAVVGAAAGAPAAAALAAEAPAAPSKADPMKDPITDKISHVLLFNVVSKPTTEAGAFEIINTSELDRLVGGGTDAGGGMGGMGGMSGGRGMGSPPPSMGGDGRGGGEGSAAAGASKPSRSAWRPLSSRGSSGGGAGGMGGVGGVAGPMLGASAGGGPRGGRGMANPMGGGMGDTNQPAATTTAKGGSMRTEFVILFVWKEPTPSDALRGEDTASPGTPAAPPPAASPPPAAGGAVPPPPPGGRPGGDQR
jgi:type IV pilus assembly protein PilM